MARPERFELPTYSSGGCRSIQLSYGRVSLVYIGAQAQSEGIPAPQEDTCSEGLSGQITKPRAGF